MNTVPPPAPEGQEALLTPAPVPALAPPLDLRLWAAETQLLVVALRALAFDAAAPRGERQHSRKHLRRTLRSRLRALEHRLDTLAAAAPPPPAEPAN